MDYDSFFPKVEESAKFLKKKIKQAPQLLVVLTGGADPFIDKMKDKVVLSFEKIPNFSKTLVEGHAGKIIFGNLDDLPIIAMQGRYHYYEGHEPQEIVFPYFVFAELGVRACISTNAVGGINKTFNPGDLVVLKDHINMTGTNPLIGIAVRRKKDQFASMTNAYDTELRKTAFHIAKEQGTNLKEGVFIGVSGPTYETRAEIGAFRILGADTVGMSTVPEVIACNFLKIKVLAINIVTNPAADRLDTDLHHEHILKAMAGIEKKLVLYLVELVKNIGKNI